MISRHRIQKVYVKELVDILRDRRTLLAMVLVPLILYPLLMLGSAQALSSTAAELGRRPIVVGVVSAQDHKRLSALIGDDPRFVEVKVVDGTLGHTVAKPLPDTGPSAETREAMTPADSDDDRQPVAIVDLNKELDLYKDRELDTDRLEQTLRDRRVHVCIVITEEQTANPMTDTWHVNLIYDSEEVRSGHAAGQVRELLDGAARREVELRIRRHNMPVEALDPIRIEETRITTPGSILGQILPVILVLMTITGAIYPAIDLTAGERERGTLETLMVCPVPVFELIAGKFLVVTTVAMVGATLNLASISATVFLGGFHQALGVQTDTQGFPFGVLPLILLLLVPFAIFFSAVMIAVSSCARTFKEAQNYVTPVILATLVPSGLAALPTSELTGGFLVMPVANIVLLTRDLLLGSPVTATAIAWVMVSTTLYAIAAVTIAARIYGSESVVFSDSGSLKSVFSRRIMKPSPGPSAAMAILTVAVLFPLWFFVQINVQAPEPDSMMHTLRASAVAMPLCLLLVPVLLAAYWKIDIVNTLRLRLPKPRYLLAGLLIGLAAWVPSAELSMLQMKLFGSPEVLSEANKAMTAALRDIHPLEVFVVLGLVPGLCEELLFRGFLMSGLGRTFRKWTAIVVAACMFAVFHFYFFKFPITAALGVVLGYLCWQSRSIWPSVIAHATHNTTSAGIASSADLAARLGIDPDNPWAHLPTHVIAIGCALVIIGVLLARRQSHTEP